MVTLQWLARKLLPYRPFLVVSYCDRRKIHKVTKTKDESCSDESPLKLVYLAYCDIKK